MGWLYVPGLEDSNLESTSQYEITEPFVTLSGKPTQRPLSWRGWKARPWIALLSGTISRPSTAQIGVGLWTSSLVAIRVNHSPAPASGKAAKTRATCGQRSLESYLRFPPAGASSRTCPGTYLLASRKSYKTWKHWVTALRRDCLARKKSVRRTGGSGCSSWGTPESHERTQTPRVVDANGNPRKVVLANQAANWPTPHTNCVTGPGTQGRDGGLNLQTAAHSHRVPPQTGANWPTPRTCAGKRSSGGNRTELVEAWESPATSGPRSLNPRFVEWLMGLPVGWTACVPAETQSFQLWRRTHSQLLQRLLNLTRK